MTRGYEFIALWHDYYVYLCVHIWDANPRWSKFNVYAMCAETFSNLQFPSEKWCGFVACLSSVWWCSLGPRGVELKVSHEPRESFSLIQYHSVRTMNIGMLPGFWISNNQCWQHFTLFSAFWITYADTSLCQRRNYMTSTNNIVTRLFRVYI